MNFSSNTAFNRQFFSQISCILMLVFYASSCEKEELTPTTFETGEQIRIFNHTGHLVAQSGGQCGSGIRAKFVLTSKSEVKEYIFEADSFGTAVIDIKKGENLKIQVFEIGSSISTLLVTRTVTYDPIIQPAMTFCPKDVLDINDF